MEQPKINILDLTYDATALEDLFRIKSERIKDMNLKISVEVKLKLYGLFKVATIGKYSDKNKTVAGFFDFETKYKNQSWEKCSTFSKEEAMAEYIKIFNELTGEHDELPQVNTNQKEFDFAIDIPEDYEGSNFYSSNAKQAKKEIDAYLSTATEQEKHFHNLKEKIYSGDCISKEYLSVFADKHHIDFLTYVDPSEQSILHISVDAMNTSAVQSLIDLNIAHELINKGDKFKMTPLHIAAINFDVKIFNTLTILCGDYNLKDQEGKRCLDYLKENEDIDKEILEQIENIKIN